MKNLFSPQDETVCVIGIDYLGCFTLPVNILQPLTRQQSEFLLALEDYEERLKEIAKPEILEQAMELTVGSEVTVEQKGEWLKGVVRYIGPLSDQVISVPVAVFFGVELQVRI